MNDPLAGNAQFRFIEASHPDWPRQAKAIDLIPVPSTRPLYDRLAFHYNRLRIGGKAPFKMPRGISFANMRSVLKGRGLAAEKDYLLSPGEASLEDQVRGVNGFVIERLSDALCQERVRGSKGDLASAEQTLNAIAVLTWLKRQRRSRQALPALLGKPPEAYQPAIILIPPASEEETILRLGLNLGPLSLLPVPKPKSEREDLIYMAELLEERAQRYPLHEMLPDEDEESGISFG